MTRHWLQWPWIVAGIITWLVIAWIVRKLVD
jgi:hypothetical protein